MTFVCIDPGLQGTGYAVFEHDKLEPVATGVLHSAKATGPWIDRATDIVDKLDDLLMSYGTKYDYLSSIARAYIELPTFFTSAKGASCATGKNGDDSDLVKLSILVGRFYECFYGENIPVEFIRVNEWKGELPKQVVIQRISRRLKYPIDAFPNHAADAVGMGLWVKGMFAANTDTGVNAKVPIIGRKK